MKAAVLEDVRKLVVRQVPDPAVGPHEVVLRVRGAGICATDFHLYLGLSHYMFDETGRKTPLREHPLILGHEFAGDIVEVGREVSDLRRGDRVVCDQGRNCHSQGRFPLCPYCASGDSHQCLHYEEHGITGRPGAMAEFICIPAVNCVKAAEAIPFDHLALVEPLGCVLHACDRMERAGARFSLGGEDRIQNVLICGAGPAGLFFLQYLRQVRKFDGLVLVSDLRESTFERVEQFKGTPLPLTGEDLTKQVDELTHGERIHLLIEACGSAAVFEQVPKVLRKQGTAVIFGNGHHGGDFGLLSNILFLEPTLVAACGASGGFDTDGRPRVFRKALDLISSETIQVAPYITHRYTTLESVPQAFEVDRERADYFKGVLQLGPERTSVGAGKTTTPIAQAGGCLSGTSR
jgi:threonine dehydrogenase-like Zn-dependent dehydrogenase